MQTFWKYLLEASVKDIQSNIEGLANTILNNTNSSVISRMFSIYANYIEIKNEKIQYDYDTIRFLLGGIVHNLRKNPSPDNIPLITFEINSGRSSTTITGFECKLNNDLFMNYHYDARQGYIFNDISTTLPEKPAIKVDNGTAILFNSAPIAIGIMMEITKQKFDEFKEYHNKFQQSFSRGYMAANQPKKNFFPYEINGKYYIIIDLIGLSYAQLDLDLKNSDFIKYLKKLDFYEFYSLRYGSNFNTSHNFTLKLSIEKYLHSWAATAPKEFTTFFKSMSEIPDIDEIITRQIFDKLSDKIDIDKYKSDDYELPEIMPFLIEILTEYYKEMGHL